MSKHTHGKWESVGAAIRVDEIDIARVYQPNGMDAAQFYANSRLIAAAPDLLTALQLLDKNGHTQATWEFALRALAKAAGE